MKTIYKYPVLIQRLFPIEELPQYASIIRVGLDPHGSPCIWAEVFTEWIEAKEKYGTDKGIKHVRNFSVFGTGMEVGPGTYVGSWVQDTFVWHLYETTART
jgi:hypothetical protein